MSKFVVDPDTLQYVSNALGALSEDFSGIAQTTDGLTPQEIGGQAVLDHLEQFDDGWRYGRTVIDEEIRGMGQRLATAKSVYELIERNVQQGAKGTIDLGRWGFAHLGPHSGAGTPTAGPHSGTGTTTIGSTGGSRSGAGSSGHGSGTGVTVVGGGPDITVHSPLLTSDQETFVGKLAALTGLSPRVVGAWCLAEESGSAAAGREAENNNNWLNIGYFDSGRGAISYDQAWQNPTTAAEQTAKFLEGSWGGSSAGIQHILLAGSDPSQQMQAIASSGWASSGYDGGATLRATYAELAGLTATRAA